MKRLRTTKSRQAAKKPRMIDLLVEDHRKHIHTPEQQRENAEKIASMKWPLMEAMRDSDRLFHDTAWQFDHFNRTTRWFREHWERERYRAKEFDRILNDQCTQRGLVPGDWAGLARLLGQRYGEKREPREKDVVYCTRVLLDRVPSFRQFRKRLVSDTRPFELQRPGRPPTGITETEVAAIEAARDRDWPLRRIARACRNVFGDDINLVRRKRAAYYYWSATQGSRRFK